MRQSQKIITFIVGVAGTASIYFTGCCVQASSDKAKFGVDSCIQDYLKAHPNYNVRDVVYNCKPKLNPVVLKAVQK